MSVLKYESSEPKIKIVMKIARPFVFSFFEIYYVHNQWSLH